jgi:hypothetical protein
MTGIYYSHRRVEAPRLAVWPPGAVAAGTVSRVRYTLRAAGLAGAVRQARRRRGHGRPADGSICHPAVPARRAAGGAHIELAPVVLGRRVRLLDGFERGRLSLERVKVVDAAGMTQPTNQVTWEPRSAR